MSYLLLLLFVTLPAFGQGPTVFLVSGSDTAAVRRDSVGAFPNGDPIIAVEPDSLVIEAIVGDTVSIELHAKDWPDVTGFFITAEGFGVGAWPDAEFASGSFLAFSSAPTVSSGDILHIGNNQQQFGQVELGGAHGSGSGFLGALILPVEKAIASIPFSIEKFTMVTVDTALQSTIEVSGNLRFSLDVRTLPAQIDVTTDLNGNGVVDFTDFVSFASAFGSSRGQGRYNELFDFDNDSSIGFSDFVLFAGDFGREGSVFRQISRG